MSRALVVKLAIIVALLLATATLLALGHDVKILIEQMLELLRAAGPVAFFLAMALLPALGAPLSLFCLTAGSAFGPQLGMPAVTVLALAAIVGNIALSYVVAGRILRPPLEALLKRFDYRLPQVQSGNATDLIVLLRVTPGVPFPVQNYLLGLSGVPFSRYLIVSCLIAFPLNAAIIFFGSALLQGKGRTALLGLMLVLALLAVVQMVRRRYAGRTKSRD